MINAKELRIGNYCFFGKDFKGQNILSKIDSIIDPINSHDPIPLTEEWLLRFGFLKRKTLSHPYFFIEIDDHVIMDIGLSGTVTIEAYDGHEIFIPADIKFVHQLQNLYFALTGKELTINNKQ